MHILTSEQKDELISIIDGEFGTDLQFADFADAMLGVLEDVAGFETVTKSDSFRYVMQLWRKYRGQKAH